jgi:hypothetical protein
MPLLSKLPQTPLIGAFLFILSSCTHHNDPGGAGNPVNNSYVKSVYSIEPGIQLIDSFIYDDQKRVATFGQYATYAGNSYFTLYDFNFSGSSTLPDSYLRDDNGSNQETHQLVFDGQGRITKDTCATTNFVTYYNYSNSYIICSILSDGTMDNAMIDSLLVTNGDVTAEKVWSSDNGVWSKQGDVHFGHATAANPTYKAEIAGTVGPLLYVLSVYNYGGWTDFISRSIMNKVTGVADGLPPGGFNYTIKVDGSGRVSGLTPTGAGAPSGGIIYNYY